MKFSKPAGRVELVSLGANHITIDELLTVKLAPKLHWLSQGASIGDAGVHPAEPLLETFEKLGFTDFFEDFDLASIKEDGLENLYKVGGDGDGHEYVVGVKSKRFYALWHGEASFEPVAGTVKEFLQWVIRERSDHLQGCPWELFLTKQVQLQDLWHREQVDPVPLLERAREVATWTREYVSPLGFELLSDDQEIDIRFKKEHRGHLSHFFVMSAKKASRVQTYLEWLKKRGFGRVWH